MCHILSQIFPVTEAASLPWDNTWSYAKAKECTICDQDGQDNQRLHKCAAKHGYYLEPLQAVLLAGALRPLLPSYFTAILANTQGNSSRTKLSIPLVNTG